MDRRQQAKRSLAHDRLVDEFDGLMNEYDVSRRLEVLIDEFLQDEQLVDKLALDAGSGTGRGSRRLKERGARVVSVDIGYNLLNVTRKRCQCAPAVADVMQLPFADDTFDIVFSTEVIEHTPIPLTAVAELYRVLKPGGQLILSTPNWLWQLPVRLATALRLRPYDGFENFVKPARLRRVLEEAGSQIIMHKGIHLLPFQLSFAQSLLRRIDNYGHYLLPIMINQCLHCTKPQ